MMIASSPKDSMPQAKEAAERALEFDPFLPQAHALLGSVYLFYEFKWSEMEKEFRHAIDLNRNYALTHAFYGWMLTDTGQTTEGIAETTRG
jgi:Tfp pilus assembly protein PilF